MALGFWQTLTTLQAPGNAITAAARTTMTAGATAARFTLPANSLKYPGDQIELIASGSISCVVTTPGTARFDLAFATIANFDTLAINLNTTAKTNVHWLLSVLGTVRSVGINGAIMWQGSWTSEALVGSPLPTVGGCGTATVPYNTAPAAGANFDMTVSQIMDLYFTQTVTTGSCTLHQMQIGLCTATGF